MAQQRARPLSPHRGRLIWRGPFLALALFMAGACFHRDASGQYVARSSEDRRNLYLGIELGELAQNNFRTLGIHNYTFHVGQRFWTPGRQRFGWRFFSFNIEVSPEHLADSGSVCCIKGNRTGLTGKESVHRLYLDYHVFDVRWKKLVRFTPVVSLGAGYTYEYVRNTRLDQDWSHGTPVLVLAVRPQVMLFNLLFSEYLTLELGVHFRRPKAFVGDAYLDRPEYLTAFGWHPIGLRIPFD